MAKYVLIDDVDQSFPWKMAAPLNVIPMDQIFAAVNGDIAVQRIIVLVPLARIIVPMIKNYPKILLEKSEKIVVVDQNSHCQMAHLANVIPNLRIFVAPNGAIVAAMTSTATVQPVLTTNCHPSTCEHSIR